MISCKIFSTIFLTLAYFIPLISEENRGDLEDTNRILRQKSSSQSSSEDRPQRKKNRKTDCKRSKKCARPNILFFIIDEQRATTAYESDELKEWKRKNLVFQTMLADQGTVFNNHYANTTACVPSRASFHTGQYPNVTGVTQTEGGAKPATDPDMTWLKKFSVPTIGNYLREAGYQTCLQGKWHVADSSIRLGDGSYLTTFDVHGRPIPEFVQYYLEQNVLHDYGYDGWIGPEPIGRSALNSGDSTRPLTQGRDPQTTQQLIDRLDEFAKPSDRCKPWFLIGSFVNPHDISTFGLATLNREGGTEFFYPLDPTLPKNLFKPEFQLSLDQPFTGRPPVQKSYHDVYHLTFQPIPDIFIDYYQRLYYTLQKRVDEELLAVWNKLISHPCMYKNTIIVLTSDHGDLLASHGKMFQKWYQAFQEAIHVPLIISSPLFGNKHQEVDCLTSHIDLLPTFLRFAKADPEVLRKRLGKKFRLNLPLPGKSLYSLIKNPNKKKLLPVYFYSEDNPTEGTRQISLTCQPYDAVVQPSALEALLLRIQDNFWKITNYYNVKGGNCGNVDGPTQEMFNLTADPLELTNLFDNPLYANEQDQLQSLLNAYREKYRSTGSPNPGPLE